MTISIYLAGPIFGATVAEANDWRKDFIQRLAHHGIRGVSPLRCEPAIGERYDGSYQDPCFGSPKAIVGKNFLDLQRCDFVLAYLPTPPEFSRLQEIGALLSKLPHAVPALTTEQVNNIKRAESDLHRITARSPQRSIGTIGEVSWAYAMQKPCAIVTDDPLMQEHPFMTVQPQWTLKTLDEAERLIVGLFADYVHTPHKPSPHPEGHPESLRGRIVLLDDEENAKVLRKKKIEYQGLAALKLSTRATNPLLTDGISTVRHLLSHSETQLLRLPNMGRKSVREIKETLAAHGLALAL